MCAICGLVGGLVAQCLAVLSLRGMFMVSVGFDLLIAVTSLALFLVLALATHIGGSKRALSRPAWHVLRYE